MGPNQSQIAVISYSDGAQVDIRFGEYSNVNDFNAAVDRVRHQRQRTRIDKALDLASTKVFTPSGGARPNVAKVMVILTDGKQTVTGDSKTLDVAVRPLREKNVTVFAVGVGKAIDINELLLLVGDDVENLFRADNFDQLAEDSLQLAAQTCKRIKPPTGEIEPYHVINHRTPQGGLWVVSFRRSDLKASLGGTQYYKSRKIERWTSSLFSRNLSRSSLLLSVFFVNS